jgi:tetratricopeptide (TPR) repeat protein
MATTKARIKDLMKNADTLALEGKIADAIKKYTAAIKADPLLARAYNRLMILYRKQKEYKKEMAIIKQAIGAYEKEIKEDQQAWKKANSKSARLNLNLAKAMGLLDDKGLPVYEYPQVMTWRRRMETVRKKLQGPTKRAKSKRSSKK